MMVAQIAWMMEVPELYKLFYDKPLQLQSLANRYKHPAVVYNNVLLLLSCSSSFASSSS